MGRGQGAAVHATGRGHLPPPCRPAVRGDRRHSRQQRGGRPARGRGRHQDIARQTHPYRRGGRPMTKQSTVEQMLRAGPSYRDDRDRYRRLVAAAEAEGILDVGYRTVDSPIGSLLVAATAQGVVRVASASEDHDEVLRRLAERVSPRILRSPDRLATAARELDEYFDGRRRSFDLPVDLRLAKGFRQAVLRHLPEIGYGRTAS